MGNDWTRLLQEAKSNGGPDGLRNNYFAAGVVTTIGAIHAWKLVRAGGGVVGEYLAERKTAAEAAKRAHAKREEAASRPTGARPAATPARDVQRPPEWHLAKLVDRVCSSLQDELGELTQVTVYEGRNSLEAIVEAYDPKRKTSMLRHYEVFYASQSIAVRTCSAVVWDERGEGSNVLGVRREGTVPDLGEELDAAVEKNEDPKGRQAALRGDHRLPLPRWAARPHRRLRRRRGEFDHPLLRAQRRNLEPVGKSGEGRLLGGERKHRVL
jgi:hypothetical protein